jgi:Ca2+-transporting ATPase
MHRNVFFISINVLMVLCQLIVMFFGGDAFSITKLDGVQWAYSVVLGVLSLPVGAIIRLLPLEGIFDVLKFPWREGMTDISNDRVV